MASYGAGSGEPRRKVPLKVTDTQEEPFQSINTRFTTPPFAPWQAKSAKCQTRENDTLQTILKKILSVQSVVSTSSSPAQTNQDPSSDLSLQLFSNIGFGSCDVVFAQLGTVHVAKRENDEGSQSAALWNDFRVRTKAEQGFKVASLSSFSTVYIPWPLSCVSHMDTAWWLFNAHHGFLSGHYPIWTLDSSQLADVRKDHALARNHPRITDLYCPEHMKESHLASPRNNDCLEKKPIQSRSVNAKTTAE
ncbi:hypothetical protein MBM_07357 [Drepanopeziza brunnea f. sp. 'multigermtubi' MB_m1]|uniref:Uncharacterized protein n=1 Tax=Marssonina brunnea f. sp. multigermtubi (strain MB_m1) TaxID=1072389 RepID=K1WNZ9_MARBU|nr:uncharacterized protein MBM_07357 [Drepanopeziza brunnea f. sp. 'multigermtubi' MB_m1]EKD14636.1 hypothetical protein MBM_07357 [Drepanopeziza brunnea f. sp. 'multigermtubi' MB_m1]